MLLRNRKKEDINKGKWIGVGGKIKTCESPDECVLREVKEETGLILKDYRMNGILTFVSEGCEDEIIFVYTADSFSGKLSECDEGELRWIPFTEIKDLSLWEGDRIFLKLLLSDAPFFSLKLSYRGDSLVEHTLRLEKLSVRDTESGRKKYRYPCCGFFSLDEKNAYLICPVCSWEDDPHQEKDPFLQGGANSSSLIEARRNLNKTRE